MAEKATELRIKEALEAVVLTHLHPHTSIAVILQVLCNDGAVPQPHPHTRCDPAQLVSCAVNAACVALMDAGVPLKACVAGASAAVLPGTGLVLDPTLHEEQARQRLSCHV